METTRVQNRSYVPRLAFVAATFRRITLCSCHPLQSSVFHFIFANLFLCMLSDSFGFHHQVPVSLFLPEDTLTLPVSLTTLTLARPVFWKLLPPPIGKPVSQKTARLFQSSATIFSAFVFFGILAKL